jgi:5-methylcytosine-specific restriction endonuclease McrA
MRKGQKTSPETRLKISLAHKGRKKNYPVWNKGKKGIYSAETIEKIRQARLRQSFTPEQKYKMGSARRGKKDTAEAREKNRQGQYRRFEREIVGYNYQDDGKRIRRKVRLLKNGGFHSKGEWENLKAQYNWTCLSCKRSEPEIKLTKDHIRAVLYGGSDNIENIQPLCKSCNSKKSTRSWQNSF